MEGGTTFHFVTDGIHATLERAKAAAGGKDVNLGGGADVAQQYLRAGLIDEMEIHVVPVLLGSGARLFDNMDGRQTAYECVRVVSAPSVSHYKYRLKREDLPYGGGVKSSRQPNSIWASDGKDDRGASIQPSAPNTRPGSSPVGSPSRTTIVPLTIT